MKQACNLLTHLIRPLHSPQRNGRQNMATEIKLDEHFVELAKRFRAMASTETGPRKADFEHLAECYEHAVLDHDQSEQAAE
jgi:hypothetical protein